MNSPIQNFKELDAWKISFELVKEIYALTSHFPKNELFGISNQMRRSAVSIPSNIAEGYCRWSRPEYARFCRIAYASAAELETQLLLSKVLMLANTEYFKHSENLLNQSQRLLNRLIQSLSK